MENETLSISIVINTLNRALPLTQVLTSLQWQKYAGEFEVIVVNGPSTDNTEEILNNWRTRIRTAQSRNIGICMAQGDIVAFINDDSIPEPEWLTQIAAGYKSSEVGGVGGFVFDHTGYNFESKYCLVDRLGRSDLLRAEPTDRFSFPSSYQVPHFPANNCTFRRSALLELNGFDEEYTNYLDVTDICLRMVDAGYVLKQLNNAYIHHRNENWSINSHCLIIKNKLYFILKHGRPYHFLDKLFEEYHALIKQYDAEKSAEAAEKSFEVGLQRGSEGVKANITPEKIKKYAGNFLPFPTLTPPSLLNIVIICRNLNTELAHDLAAQGHIVHIVTESHDINRVNFEQGVWIHKILLQKCELSPKAMERKIPLDIWHWSATALTEVERIASHRTIDVIETPLRHYEGIAFLLDGRWPLVIRISSSEVSDYPIINLNQEVIQKSAAVHALNQAIVNEIEDLHELKFNPKSLFFGPPELSTCIRAYLEAKMYWRHNRNLKISYVCGLCVKNDAVSRSIKDEINALQAYGIHNIRLYAYECGYDDLPYSIVESPEQISADAYFQSSDIIIFHFAIYNPLFDLILNRTSKAKQIVVFHNITPKEFLPPENHAVIDQSFAQLSNIASADQIICDSHTNLMVLKSRGIITPAEVLPLAVHTPAEPPLSKPSFNDQRIRLLFIGRFVKSKGPEDLLAAVETLLNNDSKLSLQLDLVGNIRFSNLEIIEKINHTLENWQKKFARQISVKIHGSATEETKLRLLHEADLFVLPTYHEGFCVPILEAIASGCKVLTYENSNTPAICDGLAYLIPTGNIEELAVQIKNAIGKTSSYEWRRSENGDYSSYLRESQKYLKMYRPEIVSQRFVNFIREFMDIPIYGS